MISEADRARICAAARSYVGIPWLGQGRSRLGMDCCGVISCAYTECGFIVDEGDVDYRSVDPKRMKETLLRHWYHLDPGVEPQTADVVVYGLPQEAHIGLLVEGTASRRLNIIHCPTMRKVVETSFDPKRGLIRGIYRWA